MKKVDMSEEAILRRLKTVDRLRELCLALMKAKKVGDKDGSLEETAVASQRKKSNVVQGESR